MTKKLVKRKGGAPLKITEKKYIKALEGTSGLLISIAKRLKVTRTTVYNFLKDKPHLEELRLKEIEKMIDIAEGVLFKAIAQREDLKAVTYFLSRKGKSRGYIEKQEIEHSGNANAPVQINIIKPDAEVEKK